MDQNPPDAYAEHVKRVRARVKAEEMERATRAVTCYAVLDGDVVEALRALIVDNIRNYSLNAQALLSRADQQLRKARENVRGQSV